MPHAARFSATTEPRKPCQVVRAGASPAQASALVLLANLMPNGLFDGESLLSLTGRSGFGEI